MPVLELLLGGTSEHDLTRLSEYRAIGGYAQFVALSGGEQCVLSEDVEQLGRRQNRHRASQDTST